MKEASFSLAEANYAAGDFRCAMHYVQLKVLAHGLCACRPCNVIFEY